MTQSEYILRKSLVAQGKMSSADWDVTSAAIRERAFFSSRVESVRFLDTCRSRISDLLEIRRDADGALASRARVVSDIMRAARDAGIARGTQSVTDPGSYARANVIIDTNAGMAAGYVQAELANSLGARMAFPAQELLRIEEREQPRDWKSRWTAAGGKIYGGRMIALKGDPVWVAISRFGQPYPPFDFNSGMGVEDVSYDDAVALGLIQEGYKPPEESPLESFNKGLEADLQIPSTSHEWQKLKATFGDQIRLVGGKVTWRAQFMREVFDKSYGEQGRITKLGAVTNDALSKVPSGKANVLYGSTGEKMGLTLTKDLVTHVKDHLHYKTDPRSTNMPLTPKDIDLLPTLWRNPDRIEDGHGSGLVFELDTADGGTLVMPVLRKGNTLVTGTLYKRKR